MIYREYLLSKLKENIVRNIFLKDSFYIRIHFIVFRASNSEKSSCLTLHVLIIDVVTCLLRLKACF